MNSKKLIIVLVILAGLGSALRSKASVTPVGVPCPVGTQWVCAQTADGTTYYKGGD